MSARVRAMAELAALVAVWGFYFVSLAGAVGSGAIAELGFIETMGWTLAGCILLSTLLSVGLDLVGDLSRRRRAVVRDEREAWAGLRATRIAHGSLLVVILLLGAISLVLGIGGETLQDGAGRWLDGLMGDALILFANGALAAYIGAEIVHYAALVVLLGRDR